MVVYGPSSLALGSARPARATLVSSCVPRLGRTNPSEPRTYRLARTTIARAAALIVSKKLFLSSGQSLLAICRWCASLFALTCEAEQQLKEVDEVQVQRQRPPDRKL